MQGKLWCHCMDELCQVHQLVAQSIVCEGIAGIDLLATTSWHTSQGVMITPASARALVESLISG
jgi:hypothetical protein